MSVERCRERTSAVYTTTLVAADGVTPIPSASITSLTLTLKVLDKLASGAAGSQDGAIINSRNAQNVLNVNNVTIHATSGLLTWAIQPADNAILDTTKTHELHRGTFEMVFVTGESHWYVDHLVEAFVEVP